MIQDLEAYRNRRIEAKPMMIGANALSLKPELTPKPILRIVKQETETTPPIEISDFIKRKNILNAPKEAEPEKFIEREIDPDKPWSAFGQVMFIREHEVDGKKIKKIAAISIAYPGGVGIRMAREALSKTSGIEESGFERWKGQKEGAIIAVAKEVTNVTSEFNLMDSFVENSGAVISERHAQSEHEVVQHFFGLQQPRKDFLETVKKHAAAILENPKFTGRSAIDPEYMNTGIYLIEGIVEDGIWKGGDPKGEPVRLVGIAADRAHKEWLEWAEKKISNMKGDGILVDAEDTETVTDCGGNKKGCSEFFEKMEGKKSISLSGYSLVSGIASTIAASDSPIISSRGGVPARYDSESCSSCGKSRFKEDGCKCSSEKSKGA